MPTPGPNVYPLDPTGISPANRIENEDHTLTPSNTSNYHFIIPQFSPFFAEGFTISHRPAGGSGFTPLVSGVDYNFAYPYVGATLQTAKPVYGAVSFINLQLGGTVRITYQTVGGEYTLDAVKLIELVANIVYNPRTTTWEQVSGAPAHFPPAPHAWTPQDLVGQQQILDKLDALIDAILNNQSNGLLSHLGDYGNPHRVNKNQVGLQNVMNFPIATIAEHVAGLATDRYATPAGVRAALSLIDTRQYLSLSEALTLTSVPKIPTWDTLLEFFRTFGILQRSDTIVSQPDRPTIIYPIETGIYTGGQALRCLSYTGVSTGALSKSQALTGNGSVTIPLGVNTVKATGRGAVGTTTATGGNMAVGNPTVTPAQFEANASISEILPTITGEQGSVSVRVVAPSYNINQQLVLNLANSSPSQRVYSASIPIGQDSSSGAILYGSVTLIYTGNAPTVTNTPGANASVTILGTTHLFEGSPNSSTLPTNRSVEVVLNVQNATTISYNCPIGTDITLSWHEPAVGTSKIQTDTVWELSSTATFNSGTIIDGTSFGKGEDFTLTAWKPTRNALTSNTTYFARSRWKFNDGTESSWSDVVQFSYQATNIFPLEGTVLARFCRNQNEWGNVADGMGGYREQILQPNAVQCGYNSGGTQTPITTDLVLSGTISVTKPEVVLIQNGGTHPYQITVALDSYVTNFLENIEDDRIRLYLKDAFYAEYLAYKAANPGSQTNFRLPYVVSKNGASNDIKLELVTNMSPAKIGKQSNQPTKYYIKISLNSTGYNSVFSQDSNKTEVVFGLDTVTMFKDETGNNFVNQGLVPAAQKTLTASIIAKTVVGYRPT